MVIGGDNHIVMSNQHLIAAHDGTDGHACGEFELVYFAAYDVGVADVTVGNRLHGLGGTSA